MDEEEIQARRFVYESFKSRPESRFFTPYNSICSTGLSLILLLGIVSGLGTMLVKLTCSAIYVGSGLVVVETTPLRMLPPASTPLTAFITMDLASFSRFFLVPIVAANSILQDRKVSPEQASTTMLESRRTEFSVYAYEEGEEDFDALIYQAFSKADAARIAESQCPSSSSSPMSPAPSSSEPFVDFSCMMKAGASRDV